MNKDSLPVAKDDASQQILDDIETFGWTTVGFDPNEDCIGYAYSVGLSHTLDHPEIVVLGLPGQHAAQLINAVGHEIKSGRVFRNGDVVQELFSGFPMAFREVPREFQHLVDKAQWLYQSSEVALLQCIWPDPNQLFPWDEGCDDGCQRVQRLDLISPRDESTGDEILDKWLREGLVEPVMLLPWAGHNALNIVYLPLDAATRKREIDERVSAGVAGGDEVNYTAKPEYDDDGPIPARIVIRAQGQTISLEETIDVSTPLR